VNLFADSASLAARFTAGFNFHDALLIGIGMVGRAELAFVVIDIAHGKSATASRVSPASVSKSGFYRQCDYKNI